MVQIVDRLLLLIDMKVEKALKGIKKFSDKIKNLNVDMEKFEKRQKFFIKLQNLFLGLGLSMLFTAMALNRFFTSILQNIFQAFLLAEGQTGAVNEKFAELQAQLAFLKFAFIDAFVETGLLDKWIDSAENLLGFLDSLDEDTKAWLIDFAIKGAIVTGVLLVLGQTFLALLGPLALLQFLSPKAFTGATAAIIGSGGLLVALGLVTFWIFKTKKEFGDWRTTVKALLLDVAIFAIDGLLLPLTSIIKAINVIRQFQGKSQFQTVGEKIFSRLKEQLKAQAALNVLPTIEGIPGVNFSPLQGGEGLQSPVTPGAPQIVINVEGSVVTEDELRNLLTPELQRILQESQGFFNGSTTV